MTKLSARLQAVADLIDHRRHADIGSDHGQLLRYLLRSGRIDFGLAIEKNRQPFNHSVTALVGLNAKVVLADGLNGLQDEPVDGVSVCGVGGRLAASILLDSNRRMPRAVVQANDHLGHLRRRMHDAGYHLQRERLVTGERTFEVMRFLHQPGQPDPIYQPDIRDAQFELGPWRWRTTGPGVSNELRSELRYWKQFSTLTPQATARVDAIKVYLAERTHRSPR